MTDRKLVYRIEVNTSQAKSEAKAFASQIKAELSNIKINVLDGRAFAGADAKIAKLRTELQSLAAVQPPKVTIDDSGLRQAAAQADNLEKQLREVEAQAKRTNAATRSVTAPRAAPTPPTGGGLGLGGIGGQLLGATGVSLTVAGIAQLTVSLDELRTKAIRADAAMIALAGGASQAKSILDAVQRASKGTVSELQAQEIAVQGLALNLAKTPAEFEKLVRAAKQITIGSATIKDLGTALTELSLFAANEKSFARADQLAVSASEVKDRMAELQAQNSSLTDSQAKLLATMDALGSKFGSVTDSAAANASGIEKLRTVLANLATDIATGPLGAGADVALGGLAAGIQNISDSTKITTANWKIILGVDDLQDNVTRIQGLLEEANLASGLERGLRSLTGNSIDADGLGKFVNTVELYNQAVDAGIPGLKDYRQALDAIADDAADGIVTPENLGALQALNTTLVLAIQNYKEFSKTQSESVASASAEEIEGARKALEDAIAGRATESVGAIGFSKTTEVLRQQLDKVKQTISDFEAQGLKGVELEIAVSANIDRLTEVFDSVEAAAQQQLGQNIATTLSDSLARGMVEANNAAFDGSAALSGYREELAALTIEIATNGFATEEQAARGRELVAIFDGAAASTGVYAALQNDVGAALLESNAHASGLASNIAILDGALASGKISAEQHAGMMYNLVGALIAVASQAGVTGEALAALQAIQNGIKLTGSPGNIAGQNAADGITAALAAQEATRQRNEQRQANERAAREQEQAAKRAGRELESAAKRAGKELESSLRSVEGLFGLSKVNQKDLDLAAAGGNVNFADDFVRRFRDLVDNGILHDGAGVEQVKQALQNIGIKPAEDMKLMLGQLEEAWQNSSLFSNKENLALINKEAVQQGLDLQTKMEEGRNNIMAFFGVTIDAATGAVSAASATNASGEELKTAVTDGQQKITDHLIAATGSAVDAATSATPTVGASGATSSIQITSVTIAPAALTGLFAGITAPTIEITSVVLKDGAGRAITTELQAEVAKQTDLLFGIGGGIASEIQSGIEGQDFSLLGPTIIEELRLGLGTAANVGLLFGMGGGIAGFLQLGFDDHDFSPSGAAVLDDIALGLKSDESKTKLHNEGGKAASELLIGFDAYSFSGVSTGITDDIAAGLASEESIARLSGIGDSVANEIKLGIGDYDFSVVGSDILTELKSGMITPKSLVFMEGIGGGIASFIHLGLLDYDFGGVGSGLVSNISDGIKSDESIGKLKSTGADIADALHNGFAAQIPNVDWIGVIVAAVIAQLNSGVKAQ